MSKLPFVTNVSQEIKDIVILVKNGPLDVKIMKVCIQSSSDS
jgi:uncharacterized protein (UPF0335 family)